MTWFDYLILGILLASLLLGVWRGVIGEIIALAAWVLAFVAARAFGSEVGNALFSSLGDPGWRSAAGFAALFFGVLAIMGLARLAMSNLVRAIGLGLADRLLGLLFGLARGGLIVLVLVAMGGMTSAPKQTWWTQAMLSAPLETAVLAVKPWLPPDLGKQIRFK
ncbi:MAG: putative colicin production protein [Pseudomonadota bacterium]|jgi:membrane protein required for colicin V production